MPPQNPNIFSEIRKSSSIATSLIIYYLWSIFQITDELSSLQCSCYWHYRRYTYSNISSHLRIFIIDFDAMWFNSKMLEALFNCFLVSWFMISCLILKLEVNHTKWGCVRISFLYLHFWIRICKAYIYILTTVSEVNSFSLSYYFSFNLPHLNKW